MANSGGGSADELRQRLADFEDSARDDARVELARTDAELETRIAEITIERDDVARHDALVERARTASVLEERLAERTIERDDVARDTALTELARTNLAEERLRVQAAELEAANEELESFSYSVSHDLRAPVRAMLGYTRAIEEDYAAVLDDEGRRLLSVVTSEASRMGALIDDLLAFSKLGRRPMNSASVSMFTLASDVAVEQARVANLPASVFTIAELPDILGDPVLLRQVWINLLANAVKYTSKRPDPQIDVWAQNEPTSVVFHVRDNGVGFDMAYADKLFGVFQRLHRDVDFAGTGVGLAIVKRVIRRHGGDVWADAKLGAGATFSFRLPRVNDVKMVRRDRDAVRERSS
jgi:light-regulated signal transduction histidine kinase (bacteriophytochrome)